MKYIGLKNKQHLGNSIKIPNWTFTNHQIWNMKIIEPKNSFLKSCSVISAIKERNENLSIFPKGI